jgi:hypothetical protein
MPVLQDHFGIFNPVETWVRLLEDLARYLELERLDLYSLYSLTKEILSSRNVGVEGRNYNDVSCESILNFLEFLVKNSDLESLEDREFSLFREGFLSLTDLND